MRIYSTLSGEKQDFIPSDQPVSMYICGITPYDDAHLGHAMSYIIFDVVRRYLEYRGYDVRHVQNFTDIDDKIINKAAETGEDPLALAQRFIDRFTEDMVNLNVQTAHVYPRATSEVDTIIDVVQGLIDNGYAYASGGDVYYRVPKFEGYGKLSNRTLDGMRAGSRIAVAEEKENPLDFTLWKGAKPGEPSWSSPWGEGRPGWHVECTAMSLRYLEKSLVIHGGGQDLIFPHHENEIAQSEAYTGVEPFARWWIHHGLMQMGEEKMSKSLGNLIRIREALPQYGADAIRLFVLNSHYRNPLTYNDESLASMKRAGARLRRAAEASSSGNGAALDSAAFRAQFEQAMDDDFNTPQALAAMFDFAREINRAATEGGDIQAAQQAFRDVASLLGLTLEATESGDAVALEPFIELLLETRKELRGAKQFAQADRIRDRLRDLGIVLEDTAQGTEWQFGETETAD